MAVKEATSSFLDLVRLNKAEYTLATRPIFLYFEASFCAKLNGI